MKCKPMYALTIFSHTFMNYQVIQLLILIFSWSLSEEWVLCHWSTQIHMNVKSAWKSVPNLLCKFVVLIKINLKITSCDHLMSVSSLLLACSQHSFCHLPDTCNYEPRKPFYLGNYPMLQFSTTISIAFALKLLDEIWTEDPFFTIIRLHSTNHCELLHLVKINHIWEPIHSFKSPQLLA